jgi:hypothetical protein
MTKIRESNIIARHGDVATMFIFRKDGKMIQVLLDTEDVSRVQGAMWQAQRSGDGMYASRSVTRSGILLHEYLHRFLLDAPSDMKVDHINHNTLDNRKINLRIVNDSDSMLNRRGPTKKNTSGFRGVSFAKSCSKWEARVQGKVLGYFSTAEEVAAVVRAKLHELNVPGY